MRRMVEGTVATLTGGLILWWVTIPRLQPAPSIQLTPPSQSVSLAWSADLPVDGPEDRGEKGGQVPFAAQRPFGCFAQTGPVPLLPAAMPYGPSLPRPETRETPARPAGAALLAPASPAGPAPAVAPREAAALPYSIPVGSVLLFENFSRSREGAATDWGPSAVVKTGPDRRKWLVPPADGARPVGRNIRLPKEFYLQCRYFAGMADVTRGLLGWWKEPIAGKISLLDDRGGRFVIQWAIGCGNDPTRLNPLGSASLCAKKYYHTVRLPGGATNEVVALQPTGTLRINRDSGAIAVLLDGQAVVAGTIGQMGQLVGFEIDVVKAASGTLSFTDFKIGR
jgi:hypothetical protein